MDGFDMALSRQNTTDVLNQIITALGPLGQMLLSVILSLLSFGVINGIHKEKEVKYLDRNEKDCEPPPPPLPYKPKQKPSHPVQVEYQYEYAPELPHGVNEWRRKSHHSYGYGY